MAAMLFHKICWKYNFLNFGSCRLQHNQLYPAPCHYAVLRVAKTASKRSIREAYLQRSKELHPDKNPGDKRLHDEFIKVGEAYKVLSDSNLRAAYDGFVWPGSGDVSQSAGHAGPFSGYSNPSSWSDDIKLKYEKQFFYSGRAENWREIREAQRSNRTRSKKNKTLVLTLICVAVVGGVLMFAQVMFFHARYAREQDLRSATLSAQYDALRESARSLGVQQSLRRFIMSHPDRSKFPGLEEHATFSNGDNSELSNSPKPA